MKVFRRRDQQGSEDPEVRDEPEVSDDDAETDVDDDRPGLSPRPDGPWDLSEQPETEGYVDLGGLRIRGREGMELRLEVEEATGAVNAATVQLGESAVQLQAFAAPRSEGIWEEIREEIAARHEF